jgi:cation diffusion facilitator family transporter
VRKDKNQKSLNQKNAITINRVVLVSFLVDITDVLVSVIIAIITGSITMFAQSLQGITDVLSSGFLFVGNKNSNKPPNKTHPYGYGRETYFWALMSGIVTVTFTATLSIYFGYKRFIDPEIVKNINWAFFALVLSVITNGYSSFISFKRLMRGKKRNKFVKTFLNTPLIEVKTSFVLDSMGTIASVLGLIALSIYRITGDIRFDGLGAILTGASLAVFSSFILIGAKDLLIGRSASPETIERIKNYVLSYERVNKIVELRTLIIGSNKLLIDLEINVKKDLTTTEIEQLIDQIENKIKNNFKRSTSIQIELEAVKTK